MRSTDFETCALKNTHMEDDAAKSHIHSPLFPSPSGTLSDPSSPGFPTQIFLENEWSCWVSPISLIVSRTPRLQLGLLSAR